MIWFLAVQENVSLVKTNVVIICINMSINIHIVLYLITGLSVLIKCCKTYIKSGISAGHGGSLEAPWRGGSWSA